jgi:hypothetical protein
MGAACSALGRVWGTATPQVAVPHPLVLDSALAALSVGGASSVNERWDSPVEVMLVVYATELNCESPIVASCVDEGVPVIKLDHLTQLASVRHRWSSLSDARESFADPGPGGRETLEMGQTERLARYLAVGAVATAQVVSALLSLAPSPYDLRRSWISQSSA